MGELEQLTQPDMCVEADDTVHFERPYQQEVMEITTGPYAGHILLSPRITNEGLRARIAAASNGTTKKTDCEKTDADPDALDAWRSGNGYSWPRYTSNNW